MVMVNNTLQNKPSEIHGQDTEVRQVTNRLPIARQNLQVFNESTVSVHNVGSMDNICSACGAFMYKDEKHIRKLTQSDTVTFSGCCGNGNIKLPPIKKPSSFTQGTPNRKHTKRQKIP